MSATRAKIIRSAGRYRKGRRGQSSSVTPPSSSAIVDSSSRAASRTSAGHGHVLHHAHPLRHPDAHGAHYKVKCRQSRRCTCPTGGQQGELGPGKHGDRRARARPQATQRSPSLRTVSESIPFSDLHEKFVHKHDEHRRRNIASPGPDIRPFLLLHGRHERTVWVGL